MNIFYVYEHWRPDRDIPFYVGKGKDNRAYNFKRNFHYNNIVKKLSDLGMCVEVRLVASGLEESIAFDIEEQRIAFWRASGVILANYTDGGEGVSNPSPEVRFKIGSGNRGKTHSEKTREKMRDSANKRFSDPAERAKCINPVEVRRNNPILQKGRFVSDETRVAQSIARTGKKDSEKIRANKRAAGKKRHETHPVSAETRAKIGAKHIGNTHALGCVRSAETRAKMSEAQKKRFAIIDAVKA